MRDSPETTLGVTLNVVVHLLDVFILLDSSDCCWRRKVGVTTHLRIM